MNSSPTIALLPLYMELYDRVLPGLRQELEPFVASVTDAIRSAGAQVESAPICTTHSQIEAAFDTLRPADPDLLVTLHLTYSPSLEAVDALCAAPWPILFFDTSPDAGFPRETDPLRLLQNHGIHGVQDLACMLRRRSRPYEIVAGHWSEADVLQRVVGRARAALAARTLRSMKALCIGGPLQGMGDFVVEKDILEKTLGIRSITMGTEGLAPFIGRVTDAEIERERDLDLQRYRVEVDAAVHRRSLRAGLGLRRLLEEEGCGAFSLNFDAFQSDQPPVDTVPFLECCKAMERGIGYAGEGDILTASFVGALSRGLGGVSFAEMFCADWAGNSLFFSHMAEFNPRLAAEPPLLYEKDYSLSAARNPAALAMAPREGPAVLANLSPGPDHSFRVILAPVEILGDGTHPDIKRWVRAWVRPPIPVAPFLEQYSLLGGSHHLALLAGNRIEELTAFARMAGIESSIIQ